MSNDKEIIAWYTANGKHIPIFNVARGPKLEQKKYREIAQAKEQANIRNDYLKSHFRSENKRVEEFMKKSLKGHDFTNIEMSNGQQLEHYSMKYMIDYILKEMKSQNFMDEDDLVTIRYKDGTVKSFHISAGDEPKNMKLSNIDGVIYNGPGSTAYAGNNVKIVNYKELYPKDYQKHEDDWRMEFK